MTVRFIRTPEIQRVLRNRLRRGNRALLPSPAPTAKEAQKARTTLSCARPVKSFLGGIGRD